MDFVITFTKMEVVLILLTVVGFFGWVEGVPLVKSLWTKYKWKRYNNTIVVNRKGHQLQTSRYFEVRGWTRTPRYGHDVKNVFRQANFTDLKVVFDKSIVWDKDEYKWWIGQSRFVLRYLKNPPDYAIKLHKMLWEL